MANKPLDSSGQSGKMLKASAKAVREQQEEVLCLYQLDAATGEATGHITFYCSETCRDKSLSPDTPESKGTTTDAIEGTVCDCCGSVIITPDPPARCIWCSSQPVSPEHDPYCSSSCAAAAEADNAVD